MPKNDDGSWNNHICVYVDAEYKEQGLPEYQGNPWIEALPPIREEDEVLESLSSYPPFHESERLFSPNYRYHYIQRLVRYFQPLQVHLDLEQKVSRAIRQGYMGRNPLSKEMTMKRRQSYSQLKKEHSEIDYTFRSTAVGFTVIGFSGVGKTTALERIISDYPQVIRHEAYNGKPFVGTQVTWLSLDCSHNGTLHSLCISFFEELDRLLGTDYKRKMRRHSIGDLLIEMSHLTDTYGIGMLIIDEIQTLSLSPKGGAQEVLNFFVKLVNKICMPVVLVGTNKAARVLQREFRQARRGSGQGDLVWNNMPNDEYWELVISGMWEYQWTDEITPFTQEWKDIMYDKSQGIVDVAVKLFVLSQVRTISLGAKQLTKTIVNQVAADSLRLVEPMIRALRSGIPSEIAKYEDLQPINMEVEMEKYKASIDLKTKIIVQKQTEANKRKEQELSLTEEVALNLIKMNYPPQEVEKGIQKAIKNLGDNASKAAVQKEVFMILEGISPKTSTSSRSNTRSKNPTPQNRENLLLWCEEQAKKAKRSVYEELLANDLIANPLEESWKGDGDASLLPNSLS